VLEETRLAQALVLVIEREGTSGCSSVTLGASDTPYTELEEA